VSKMNWDKINREKPGASYGGPVVSYISNKLDTRPVCGFYSISRKNNRRICGNRVSKHQGHGENFCEGHQGYVLLSKERGWFQNPEVQNEENKKRKAQKKYEKNERILAYEMERRYRRGRG
jgi:hypothetical protein